jgi:hypothetical protein
MWFVEVPADCPWYATKVCLQELDICLCCAGLAKFRLLPELVSATKQGSTSLPDVTYDATTDLPTVKNLKGFADVRR